MAETALCPSSSAVLAVSPPRRFDRLLWIGILIYALALVSKAFLLPAHTFDWVASESGPFERLTIVFWGLLAFASVTMRPVAAASTAAIAALALFCAAREADWHVRFTGYSVLKPGFYLSAAFPVMSRILGGAVVGLAIASAAMIVVRGGRRLWSNREHRLAWGQAALAGTIMFMMSKTLDRLPQLGRELLNIDWAVSSLRIVRILEEGLECLVPLLFVAALVLERRGKRLLAVQAPEPPTAAVLPTA